jgi:FMN reductase
MNIVSLSGSPSRQSRSACLLGLAQSRVAASGCSISEIRVRELPAQALLHADISHPELRAALEQVAAADIVLVATPIYKAAYSGVLKAFLDLLPQDGLRGKTVLPLATGGSPGHLLALDYALKPVLGALGARHILDAVYVHDSQLQAHEQLGYVPDDSVLQRLNRALQGLADLPAREASRPAPEPMRC